MLNPIVEEILFVELSGTKRLERIAGLHFGRVEFSFSKKLDRCAARRQMQD